MTVSFLIPKQEGNNVMRTVQKILFLVICLAMAASGTATAAEGSGNIDGGGGGGTSTREWKAICGIQDLRVYG